jgi:hypothetical protein
MIIVTYKSEINVWTRAEGTCKNNYYWSISVGLHIHWLFITETKQLK